MKIDATQNAAQTSPKPAAPNAKFQADFRATLETAKQNIAQPGEDTTQAKTTKKSESQMTPQEFLEDYLRKSPEQRMRDAILREMGLTEEELAALPPGKRAEVEQEITEKIKERLLGKSNNTQHGQSSISRQSLST